MRLATISTIWQNRRACNDSRNGLRGTSSPELSANDLRSLDHRLEFRKGDFLRQVQATAIGENVDTFGRYELQSFANALGNDFRCFDFVCLHVDHSDSELEAVRKFFEQFQIFAASPRKLE